MIKKLFIALLMTLSLHSGVVFAQAFDTTGDISSGGFRFDLNTITHPDLREERFIQGGINYIFNRIITIMATTIGSVAVLIMVIGGFMILISAGDQNLRDKGVGYVKRAAIGLVFVLGAYIIVTAVQLAIVTLT